jgi:uncharacterized membrane protein SpoIIM required for sporulation
MGSRRGTIVRFQGNFHVTCIHDQVGGVLEAPDQQELTRRVDNDLDGYHFQMSSHTYPLSIGYNNKMAALLTYGGKAIISIITIFIH